MLDNQCYVHHEQVCLILPWTERGAKQERTARPKIIALKLDLTNSDCIHGQAKCLLQKGYMDI